MKILCALASFGTIVLGVSVFVPSVAVAASCPALNPGDEVKVVGSPAIYVLNNNSELMAYFSGYEYKTYRAAYGGYISITDACYVTLKGPSAQPLFVNFRPGTYVLRRESSPQLYVSEPGNTIAKITMAAAQGLYGSDFKPQIIKNAEFGSYIRTGADVTVTAPYPGMLINIGGKIWYVTADKMIREVTPSGLLANGFQTQFTRAGSASWITGLGVGNPIIAEEKFLTDKTQQTVSAGTTVAPPTLVPRDRPVDSSGNGGIAPVSAGDGGTVSGRDQQRINDLQALQKSLALYFADMSYYPYADQITLGMPETKCLNSDGWRTTDDCPYAYMPTVPADPGQSSYVYNSTGASFSINAHLEGANNGLAGDITATPEGISQR